MYHSRGPSIPLLSKVSLNVSLFRKENNYTVKKHPFDPYPLILNHYNERLKQKHDVTLTPWLNQFNITSSPPRLLSYSTVCDFFLHQHLTKSGFSSLIVISRNSTNTLHQQLMQCSGCTQYLKVLVNIWIL